MTAVALLSAGYLALGITFCLVLFLRGEVPRRKWSALAFYTALWPAVLALILGYLLSRASRRLKARLKATLIVIPVLAFEITLLFVPGGAVDTSVRYAKTGCDKQVTAATYRRVPGGGVFRKEFCGSAPATLDALSSLTSDRGVQILLGWLLIALSILICAEMLRVELRRRGEGFQGEFTLTKGFCPGIFGSLLFYLIASGIFWV